MESLGLYFCLDAQRRGNPVRIHLWGECWMMVKGWSDLAALPIRGLLLPHPQQPESTEQGPGKLCRLSGKRTNIQPPVCFAICFFSKQGFFQVAESALRHDMWISVKCSKYFLWKIPWRCPGLFSASGLEADPDSTLHTLLPPYWCFNP